MREPRRGDRVYRHNLAHCHQALDNFLDDVALDKGESFIPAKVGVGQFALIKTQLMKNCGVHIAEMVRLFDGM